MYGLCRQTTFPPGRTAPTSAKSGARSEAQSGARANAQACNQSKRQVRPLLAWLLRLAVLCWAFWLIPAYAMVEANSAPAADLMAIKGIGPATSRKMLEARQQAPFTDWADLVRRVKGVGAKTAVRMSDSGLRVNGQAWPTASASVTAPVPPALPVATVTAAPSARFNPPGSAVSEPAERASAPPHLPAAPRWNPR